MSGIISISSETQFQESLNLNERNLTVIHFGASWSPNCTQINEILNEFNGKSETASFVYVEAEKFPQLAMKYGVTAVPTLVFMKRNQVLKTLKGGHPKDLKAALMQLCNQTSSAATKPVDLETRLRSLIDKAPVMLFMKGNPTEPKCGFSRKIVGLLADVGATYDHFDILSDNEVREGLKKFSNWPTYPQLYVQGELTGGIDIVQEMIANGELAALVKDTAHINQKKMEERLKELINLEKVMLFMKGSPQTPKCGFSRSTIEILTRNKIQFGYFDILTDDSVRQGLKVYSDWPTYPQLYSKGILIGGIDIIKELDVSGELVSSLD